MKPFDIEVSLADNTLDQYENMMSRHREWKGFKREIRLANLLESGKKIQFDIESISMLMPLGCEEKIVSIQLTALEIKSIHFILKEEKVLKLTLKCIALETPMGKIVRDLMVASVPIEIRQHVSDGKIVYFYVDSPENNAA